MDSEKLPFNPIHFFLNLFLPYTDRYAHLHMEPHVPLGFKIIIHEGVDETMGIAQGQVYSFAFAEFVPQSNVPPLHPTCSFGVWHALYIAALNHLQA